MADALVETVAPPKDTGYATIIHVMALLGNFLYFILIPLPNIIIPWVMWLYKRKENPFIDEHGREAIRFQLFMTLWWILYVVALLFLYGGMIVRMIVSGDSQDIFTLFFSGGTFLFVLIPGGLTLFVVSLYCPIMAAMRANDGKPYRYPFTFSPRAKTV